MADYLQEEDPYVAGTAVQPDLPAESGNASHNRMRAADLAQRGIPMYRNASGDVTELTDESGAALTHFDRGNEIAYDSKGQPKLISYDSDTGPPTLKDPFADLPTRMDKEGNLWQQGRGLSRSVGVDVAQSTQYQQEEADKQLAKQATLMGRKNTLDEYDLSHGAKDHKKLAGELQMAVPTLAAPDAPGDVEGVHKTIDDHFDTQYAAEDANERAGWFSSDLSPEAQARRLQIDQAKAEAHQKADDLAALTDHLGQLKGEVQLGHEQERLIVEQQLAHSRGEPGPLDEQPTEEAPAGAPTQSQAAATALYPSQDDWSKIASQDLNAHAQTATTAVAAHVEAGEMPPEAAQAVAAAPPTAQAAAIIPPAGADGKRQAEGFWASMGRSFASKIFPALGTGVGAIAGTAGGAAAGIETGPGAIVTGLLGGAAGGVAGGVAADAVQRSVMGEKWTKENDAQMEANAQAHPVASMIGTLVPFLVSMIGGAEGAIVKGGGKLIGKTITPGAREALEAAFATGTKYEAPMLERVVQNAAKGFRAGTSQGAQENLIEGKEVNPLDVGARDALSFGALGLFKPAQTILGAVLGRAPADAATVTLAGNLYDAAIHGKPFDLQETADQMKAGLPAFALQNGIIALLHGAPSGIKPREPGGSAEAGGSRGGEPPPEPPSRPPTATQRLELIDLRLNQIKNSGTPWAFEAEVESLNRQRTDLVENPGKYAPAPSKEEATKIAADKEIGQQNQQITAESEKYIAGRQEGLNDRDAFQAKVAAHKTIEQLKADFPNPKELLVELQQRNKGATERDPAKAITAVFPEEAPELLKKFRADYPDAAARKTAMEEYLKAHYAKERTITDEAGNRRTDVQDQPAASAPDAEGSSTAKPSDATRAGGEPLNADAGAAEKPTATATAEPPKESAKSGVKPQATATEPPSDRSQLWWKTATEPQTQTATATEPARAGAKTALAEPPPKYRPAVTFRGETFEGATHEDAVTKLAKRFPNYRDSSRKTHPIAHGYLTPEGKFEKNLLAIARAEEGEEATRLADEHKGARTISGVGLTIQHTAGETRKKGHVPLGTHYGTVTGVKGADGMVLDAVVKPGTREAQSGPIFVVNQTGKDGTFDEHKAVFGADSPEDATAVYRSNFPKDFTGVSVGSVATFRTPAEFKAWTKSGAAAQKTPAINVATPEGVLPFRPQGEGEQIISTGVERGGVIHQGSSWNQAHDGIGMEHELLGADGMPNVAQAERGFVVQAADGSRYFTKDRNAAGKIAKAASQSDTDTNLQSSDLHPAGTPAAAPAPKGKAEVFGQLEKAMERLRQIDEGGVGKGAKDDKERQSVIEQINELSGATAPYKSEATTFAHVPGRHPKGVPTLEVQLLQVSPDFWMVRSSIQFSSQGMGGPLHGHFPTKEAALADAYKTLSARLKQITPTASEKKIFSTVQAELERINEASQSPRSDTNTAAASYPKRDLQKYLSQWRKSRAAELDALGAKLVSSDDASIYGEAGLAFQVETGEIVYNLGQIAVDLARGQTPRELVERLLTARLNEEQAHATDLKVQRAATGDDLEAVLKNWTRLWGSLSQDARAALKTAILGNPAAEENAPGKLAAEYVARLFMRRHGLDLPETIFRDTADLLAALDGEQPDLIENHLAQMEAVLKAPAGALPEPESQPKAPAGANAPEPSTELDAAMDDLLGSLLGNEPAPTAETTPSWTKRGDPVPEGWEEYRGKGGWKIRTAKPKRARKAKAKATNGKTALSSDEQSTIDDAVKGLFATPLERQLQEIQARLKAKAAAIAADNTENRAINPTRTISDATVLHPSDSVMVKAAARDLGLRYEGFQEGMGPIPSMALFTILDKGNETTLSLAQGSTVAELKTALALKRAEYAAAAPVLFATAQNFKTEQKPIEIERVEKFTKLAVLMLDKGIETPQAAADFMRANIGHQMLPFAQALWDGMAMVKPELYGTHDWDALFAQTAPEVVTSDDKTPAPEPVEKIEDFGEKISGARKDAWKTRGLNVGDYEGMNEAEREAYTTRDNDAELWHASFPGKHPTVAVINPPFSATGGRTTKNNSMNGAKQLEVLLDALEPGGRLVAIVGEGMGAVRPAFLEWWQKIAAKYSVRANLGLSGDAYRKYGTTFDNQLLVIDKPLADEKPEVYNPLTQKVGSYAELIPLLAGVRSLRATAGTGVGSSEPDRNPTADQAGAGSAADAGSSSDSTPALGTGTAAPGPKSGGSGRKSGGKRATGGAQPKPESEGSPAGVSERGAGPSRESLTTGGRTRGSSGDASGAAGLGSDLGAAELGVESKAPTGAEAEVTDAVFVPYAPAKMRIAGAQPHPTPLVESAAMAAVQPPNPTYKPKLAQEIITSGAVSEAQLEPVVYAGQAHAQLLPDGKTRQGYFIGDGTGVGKGREIAAIILDNRNHKRTKAIWISEKQNLIASARRDLDALGGENIPITTLNKVKARTGKIDLKQGVLYATYDTLKVDNQLSGTPPEYRPGAVVRLNRSNENATVTKARSERGKWILAVKTAAGEAVTSLRTNEVTPVTPAQGAKSRLDQVVEWFGADYDGSILLDESHNAANSLSVQTYMGAKAASQKAIAVVALQERLPNARIVYVSATAATEVSNFAYADRLGLWGPGAFFTDKTDFITKIAAAGLSAMEIIARDLKTLGLMNARTLSFGATNPDDPNDNGVEFDMLQHDLSDEQIGIFNEMARGWQFVFANMNEALESTGGAKSGLARGRARGAFFSAAQRFFNQTLTAMQMPTLLADMHKELDAGRSCVLQIVNTNEATLERGLQAAEEQETPLDEIDTTPKDILRQYIARSFPTALFQPVTDANGNETWVMATGPDGLPIQDPAAIRLRDQLLDKITALPVPNNPLEQIMDEFGPEAVAEITGRKRRIVQREKEGALTSVLEERSDAQLRQEAKDFNDLKRRILIFSDKGGTGESYHADRGFINQQRRVHYLVQAGWRADKAMQGLGRSHRSNQAHAPMIKLLRTNLDAHKRFISTIARRLSSLGALTSGERRSTGQGLFTAADNLENEYSQRALDSLIEEAHAGAAGALPWELITEKLGMDNLVDEKSGKLRESAMPSVPQFLNRLLALEFEEGNAVFTRFFDNLTRNIDKATEEGTYDPGLQILDPGPGGSITKQAEEDVYTHEGSGGKTRLVQVQVDSRSQFNTWTELVSRYGREPDSVIENKRSGSLFAIYTAGNITDRKTGAVVPSVRKVSIRSSDIVPASDVTAGPEEEKKFTTVTLADAPNLWASRIAESDPMHHEKKTFLVGLFLPIWNRLQMDKPRVFQFKTTDRERMLGILIPPKSVSDIRRKLSLGMALKSPAEVISGILDDGLIFQLANGWRIRRSRVGNEPRIEAVGLALSEQDEFEQMGGFIERIAFKPRYFVPTGDKAAGVITKILAKSPVTNEATPETLSATPLLGPLWEKTVKPLLVGSKAGIAEITHQLVRVVSPSTGTAPDAQDTLMKMLGGQNQAAYILHKTLEVYQKALDKMPRDAQVAFVDNYKVGHKQATPELDALDTLLRNIDAQNRQLANSAAEDLGIDEMVAWKDNHFRVMWKVVPGQTRPKHQVPGTGRKPLRGSRGMLRQATLDSMSEGIARGGEPFSWNPVTNFKQAQADIMKLTHALRVWKWAKDTGHVKFVRGKFPKPPVGYTWLKDSIAKVYFPATSGEGLIETGQYAVEENFGRQLNNYLSRDFIRESAFGRGLLWLKNATTAIELSLSVFHGIFETGEAIGSNIGLGLSKLANRGAAIDGIMEIIKSPAAPVTNFRLGDLVREAAGQSDLTAYFASKNGQKLAKLFPRAQEYLGYLFEGGWKPTEVEADWRNNSVKAFTDALNDIKAGKDANYIGAFLRAFPAGNEMLMKPLFERYIPSLKVGQFFKEFDEELKRNDLKYPQGYYIDRLGKRWMRPTNTDLARKVWRLVEDRFGELNYDTLFWNRTFKSGMQIMFRSVTWKLGSVEAFGGAFAGQGKEFMDAVRERRAPELHRNMAWLLGMLTLTAALGTVMSIALGHRQPKSLLDLVFPQIDPKDDSVRVALPTYFKDMVHLIHGPTGYIVGSMSGWIGRVMDLLRNKDYYGVQIRDTDSPLAKQAMDVSKYTAETLLPFSIRGYRNLSAQDVGGMRKALASLGVNPAPRYLSQSDAERKVEEYWKGQRTEAGVRPAQFEASSAKRKLVAQIKHGDAPDLNKALKEGTIKPRDIKTLYQRANRGALVSGINHMPLWAAEKVYQEATAQEKLQLEPIMARKRANALSASGRSIFTGF